MERGLAGPTVHGQREVRVRTKLRVLKDGTVVKEYGITTPSVLIGRGEHCDVVLDFPGVGREMARLTVEAGGFSLVDVSIQGVLVDGERITRRMLHPGQEITCGSIQLELIEKPDDCRPEDECMQPAGLQTDAGAHLDRDTPDATGVCLVEKNRPDMTHEIFGEECVIGRNPELSDLPIHDWSVSSRHARIVRTGAGHTIIDLESSKGTFVNGKQVGDDPVQIKEGDEIRIGQAVFVLRHGPHRNQPSQPQHNPPHVIDMASVHERAAAVVAPETGVPEIPKRPPKRRPLLLLLFVLSLVSMIIVITLSSKKPRIDPADLLAIETLTKAGKLVEAETRLSELAKRFPAEPRLKILSDRILDAKKRETEGAVADLLRRAGKMEASGDLVGAAEHWAEALKAAPDNAEVQRQLCHSAYRIALIYEGQIPEAETSNAVRYLEMIEAYVKPENGEDYQAALELLAVLRR
ncbi:MAG: FHA domain-containing protein [Acidobacteria bacterium]|nr:FHA domain-containing protein [Acidobacteriota bacterium]